MLAETSPDADLTSTAFRVPATSVLTARRQAWKHHYWAVGYHF